MMSMSKSSKANVLILPFPTQGHINPMLQLAKRLASKGPKITLITTNFIIKYTTPIQYGPVQIRSISDGFDETGFSNAVTLDTYVTRFQAVGFKSLLDLIEKEKSMSLPFTCIVYDTFVPWGLDVAKQVGLTAVAFSTQSCVVSAIYYYVNNGLTEVPKQVEVGSSISVANSVPLERSDFPSFALRDGTYLTLGGLALDQFSWMEKSDWVLFNSFDELESEVLTCLKGHWRARAIGPTVPMLFINVENNNKDNNQDYNYGMNLFQIADSYMEWLDSKPPASVVYISFGSFACLDSSQTTELATALTATHHPFIWVVRTSEQKTLPNNFMENLNTEKGLVVPWTHQLAVLSHKSLGCFMTHCGWNSTLEALSLGVPMVAVPQWTDQLTNAKYVEDVWKLGVRAKKDDKGVVSSEEAVRCLNEVMGNEEMRANARKWKEKAKAAVNGGSSDQSLDEFVDFVNGEAEKGSADASLGKVEEFMQGKVEKESLDSSVEGI